MIEVRKLVARDVGSQGGAQRGQHPCRVGKTEKFAIGELSFREIIELHSPGQHIEFIVPGAALGVHHLHGRPAVEDVAPVLWPGLVCETT